LDYRKIEELRLRNNITQLDLASKLGKSREWYTKMLKREDIMTSDLIKLAEVLGVDVNHFYVSTDHYKAQDHGSKAYNKSLDAMIETNKKTLEAMLDMRDQLDNAREKLTNCEKEIIRLKSILPS